MKTFRIVLLALANIIIALAAGGCSREAEGDDLLFPVGRYQDDVFAAVNISRDIAYGSAVDRSGNLQTLLLDLYEPADDTVSRRAAIVWIHGGGFVSGSKATAPIVDLAQRYARKGYLTVSIDYRLATPAQFASEPWPVMRTAMFDAKAAVRWLRANAGSLRVDSGRIVAGGGSAGAFTALHAAYLEEEGDSGNPGFSSAIGAVIDFWGGMSDVSEMEAGEAPLVIIHGSLDQTVPFAYARQLESRAQAVGVAYDFHPLEGAGHSAWQFMEDYVAWITPFLYRHVIGQP
ncbi:MAG TPA: alpha/beta hydrolase [Candidatus Binatia bacterium]|nr:alpha/beta hydrolase [Candidatus Binatia bacterium]